MGRENGGEEEPQEREKIIADILSHITSQDEKVLWRGKAAERIIKRAESLIKWAGRIMTGGGAVWALIFIISSVRKDLETTSFIISLSGFFLLILFPMFHFLSVKNEAEKDYFITSKKVVEIDRASYITAVDLDKIDEVTVEHRFNRWVEFFILRDNKSTRSIRQINFYSEYLAKHPEDCRIVLIDGNKVAQEDEEAYLEFEGDQELIQEHRQEYGQLDKKSGKKDEEKSNLLSFPYLDDWKKAKEILKELILEKF